LAEQFLKPEITFQQLSAQASAMSDNEAAQRLNNARTILSSLIYSICLTNTNGMIRKHCLCCIYTTRCQCIVALMRDIIDHSEESWLIFDRI